MRREGVSFRSVVRLLVACSTLVHAGVAGAQTPSDFDVLYGVNSVDANLTLVDPSTGGVTFVGPVGTPVPIGMAVRPGDGTIFVWDNFVATLMTVDPCTGQGTSVVSRPPVPSHIGGIAISPDGRIFGVDALGQDLIEFLPETGEAVDLGPLYDENGLALSGVAGGDYGPDGQFYAIVRNSGFPEPTRLVTIDPGLLRSTTVAVLDLSPFDVPQSIAFDSSGRLLGTSQSKGLFEIDPSSGATRLIANVAGLPQGMDFGPTCIVSIGMISIEYGSSMSRGSGLVMWTTSRESDLQGFNIVIQDPRKERVQLNRVLIPCEQCITGAGATYSFIIPKHKNGQDIFIEAVGRSGRVVIFGPASRK